MLVVTSMNSRSTCECGVVGLTCDRFVFKQKTADEMRISDWSSDVCSSDLRRSIGENLNLHKAIERKFFSHADPNAPCLHHRMRQTPKDFSVHMDAKKGRGKRKAEIGRAHV